MIVIKKHDDEIENEVVDGTIKRYSSLEVKEKHLCGEPCDGLDGCKCPKISNEENTEISEYDFIQEGYQVFKDDGSLVKFVVSKCKNFKPYTRKSELINQRYLLESLKILYFDAENLEEANKIQQETERQLERIRNIKHQ